MDGRKFVASTSTLAGLAAYGAFGPARAQGSGPIKIGLLTPLTGVVASGGKEIQEGFELYWKQVGHKIAGREVQVFVAAAGRLCLQEEGLQEDHHHLAGLHLRPRAVRRLRAAADRTRRNHPRPALE